MSEESRIDPKHSITRLFLRILGPTIAGFGVLFMVIGVGSFFSSFGTFEPPRYFWCLFVGMPLLFVGIAMCMFAFLGSFSRYISGEAAPVQKDTFNYLAEGAKEGVRTVGTALGEGLAAGMHQNEYEGKRCLRCHHDNEMNAKFCKNCGASLTTPE